MKKLFYILFAAILMVGCATVPKETIQMSNLLGKQIAIIQEDNENLINATFDYIERVMLERQVKNIVSVMVDTLFQDSTMMSIISSNDTARMKQQLILISKDIQTSYVAIYDDVRRQRENYTRLIREKYDLANDMNNLVIKELTKTNITRDAINKALEEQSNNDDLIEIVTALLK